MKAIATIKTTKHSLADGQVAGQFKVSIVKDDLSEQQSLLVDAVPVLDEDGAATGDFECPPVTFPNVSAGSWSATACRLDEDGESIAPAVTSAFVVVESADVPSAITVTFS